MSVFCADESFGSNTAIAESEAIITAKMGFEIGFEFFGEDHEKIRWDGDVTDQACIEYAE